ncbi:MAG: WYL domain-containing protein [Alphaproteobacteria bacterium]|nr:WYL domain-containing protein [Alphaproteobacteria bacterium]MBU1562307.1 WYL domain-containing protein [Alphaproteobacteria bacterium]MBU2302721.1 WYL domain-containing protein [Alphaproteobacteria bacterium]MBU2369290.1 WYL domain-containing protein [Alphaproteobacteria bacterium]
MVEREARPWGQAKRFEFMEWRLFWTDRLNRKDLELEFGISTPQASIDLRNYQEVAPNNLAYDSTLKSYVRAEKFEPVFLRVSADRLLLQLRALRTGAIELADTWFSDMPEVDVLPKLSRSVSDDLVRKILIAINRRRGLIITYMSLQKNSERIIGPHALAYDGHRWHLRAWCFEKKDFRDFLLTRITNAVEVGREDFHPVDDIEWSRFTNLKLCADPRLDEHQRKTIEHDFGMTNGCVEIKIRIALAFYFIKRHNLDIESLPPERQQFVLKNLKEVMDDILKAREDAKKLSQSAE